MKTKLKSPGSLVIRSGRYYCYWRVNGKMIGRALRNENGGEITTEPDALKAKARLMEVVAKENKVKALRSIASEIDATQTEIARLNDEKNPPMPLARVWMAFASPTSGRKPVERSSLLAYENVWTQFQKWTESAHPAVKTLREVDRKSTRPNS